MWICICMRVCIALPIVSSKISYLPFVLLHIHQTSTFCVLIPSWKILASGKLCVLVTLRDNYCILQNRTGENKMGGLALRQAANVQLVPYSSLSFLREK